MSNRSNALRYSRIRLATKVATVAAAAPIGAPTASLAKRSMSYLPKGWTDTTPTYAKPKQPGKASDSYMPASADDKRNVIGDVSDAPMRWEREGPTLFDDMQQNRLGVRGMAYQGLGLYAGDPTNGQCLARESARDALELAILEWGGVVKTYDDKGRVIDCRLAA